MIVGVVLVFGLGSKLPVSAAENTAPQPPSGLTTAEWQQIETQLPAGLQQMKLTADDAQIDDYLGGSVAVSGDTAVVGARGEDGGPGNPLNYAGAAYVFSRNQGGAGNWGQVAKLTAADAQDFDFFGGSVAISGDTIVVGANGEDGGPGDPLPDAGAAYVFERDQGGAGAWGQAAKLTAADAQADAIFGVSVAVSGSTVVVGASRDDGPLPDAGAAYVFERNQGGTGAWGQAAKLTADDPRTNDSFGISAAISGETIIVGAWAEDGGPENPL
jgi:hypothetical protein